MESLTVFLKTARIVLCCVVPLILASCSGISILRFSDPAEEIRKNAAKGDALSQLYVAHILEEGAGLPKDHKSAAEWYRKSVDQGNPRACYALARMMLDSSVLPQNDADAVRLLFQSADAGFYQAQVLLGGLYLAGRGGNEFAAQIKRYKRRAEQGEAQAFYSLGWIYQEGAGVPRSRVNAKKWLTRGDEQGNVLAARILGDITLTEQGKDREKAAANWYEKGARSGDVVALSRLLLLKERGSALSKTDAALPPPKLTEIDHDYRELQNNVIKREEGKDIRLAMVASRRILDIDPSDSEGQKHFSRLREKGISRLSALYSSASKEIASGNKDEFRSIISKLLTEEFDEQLLGEVVASYWSHSDEIVRNAERSGSDLVGTLESLDNDDSIRKSQAKIKKLTLLFHEAIGRGLKERPEDPELTALLHKGDLVISDISRKRDDIKEKDKEKEKTKDKETDSGVSLLNKGRSLLHDGHFDAAAKLFEKLTRTPGYTDIAIAYVYLGIANLARINPSKIVEAKKLRLKGFSSFQNAMRFDRMVTLPANYEKFRDVFEEAKKLLK
jgi:TPR repeat protein